MRKKKCSFSKSMEGKNLLFRVWKGWGWGVQFCVKIPNVESRIPRIPFQTLITGDTQKAYQRKLQLNKIEGQKENKNKMGAKKWNYD